MNAARRDGLKEMALGAALITPGFGYLWLVDYFSAPLPSWGTPLAVGLSAPFAVLILRGFIQATSGQTMRELGLDESPLKLRQKIDGSSR